MLMGQKSDWFEWLLVAPDGTLRDRDLGGSLSGSSDRTSKIGNLGILCWPLLLIYLAL